MKKRIFKNGDLINDMIFIEELPSRKQPSGKIKRMALLKCKCGNIEKKYLYSVLDGTIKNCSICGKKSISKKNFKHGLIDHKIYRIWADIKKRCFNENHISFKNYGEKGITMYIGWKDDFKSFYDYVSNLESYRNLDLSIKGLTIDRINNNLGYVPGNIRWADMTMQNINRGLQLNNKSGYRGISIRTNGTFQVQVRLNKKNNYVGTFKTMDEAIEKRNEKLQELGIISEYTKYERTV